MDDGNDRRRLTVHLVVRRREKDAPRAVGAPEEVTVRFGFPGLGRLIEVEGRIVGASKSGPRGADGTQVQLEIDTEGLAQQLSSLARELTQKPESPAKKTGASFRALLIEDNPQISDMYVYGIRRYFENRNTVAVVDVVANAEGALHRLGADEYDLVVTDFYLPGTDGAQLIARLRSEPRLARMPVVAISAGGKDVRAALLGAGADRFLQKPIVLRDLFATLEQLLREKSDSGT